MELRAARLAQKVGEKREGTAAPPPIAVAEREAGKEKEG